MLKSLRIVTKKDAKVQKAKWLKGSEIAKLYYIIIKFMWCRKRITFLFAYFLTHEVVILQGEM